MSDDAFLERIARVSQGFMDAKILMLGVEMGIFDRLARGAATADGLAADLLLTARGTEILCDALVALEYLTKKEGEYTNTERTDRYLVRDREGSMAHIIGHRNQMFRSWAQLDEVIRHGKSERERDKETLADQHANRNFILGMAEVSRERQGAIIDHLRLDEAGRFVDLGGGPGHYACEAARRYPELEAVLVDLPLTVEVAREYIAGQELDDRVRTLICDFYREPVLDLGPTADVVLISQVMHAEGPEANVSLLCKLADAVKPGGRVVIAENLVEPDRTRPTPGARFAVNMLAGTVRGRTYTGAEIMSWLLDAGFEPGRPEQVAPRTWLVEGTRPAEAQGGMPRLMTI